MSAPPVPADRDAIADHLDFLYGDRDGIACVAAGRWDRKTGRIAADGPGRWTERFFAWPRERTAAVAWIAKAANAGKEAYACAHLLTDRSRKKEQAAPVWALYNDTDDGDTLAGPRPTRIVCTSGYVGTKGERDTSRLRAQSYWALSRGIPPNEAEALNRRLATAQGTEKGGGWDLTQVLRPAGTLHGKTATRWLVVDATEGEPGPVYDPDVLAAMLPPAPAADRTRPAAPIVSATLTLDDRTLLERCRGSAMFRRLEGGDLGDYGGDRSRADLGFCDVVCRNHGTPEQATRLLRASALYREKWDRDDYRARTLARAFDGLVQPWAPRTTPTDTAPSAPDRTGDARLDAALREIADLRARLAQAERERDEARELYRWHLAAIRSPNLGPERVTAAAIVADLALLPDGEAVPLPHARTAANAGIGKQAVPRHIARVQPILDGLVEFQKHWVPDVDRITGEVMPTGHHETYARRLAPPVAALRAIALAPEPATGKKNGHGGTRPRCPRCGGESVLRHYIDVCGDCKKVLRKGKIPVNPGKVQDDTYGGAEAAPSSDPVDTSPTVDVLDAPKMRSSRNDEPAPPRPLPLAWDRARAPAPPDRYTDGAIGGRRR